MAIVRAVSWAVGGASGGAVGGASGRAGSGASVGASGKGAVTDIGWRRAPGAKLFTVPVSRLQHLV